MQEKLKNINFKISDLAYLLDISRPTLYKFIELFEKNKLKQLPNKIITLFQYIKNEEFLTKQKLLKFILNNNQNENFQILKPKEKSNACNQSKTDLIDLINNSKQISFFVLNIYKLLQSLGSLNNLSLSEIEFINSVLEKTCKEIKKTKKELKN